MTVATFPNVRFGPGRPGRYRLRDVKTFTGRNRAKEFVDRKVHRLWEIAPLEILCQAADSADDENERASRRGAQGQADFEAIREQRLTEAECNGDIEPVSMVVVDTLDANKFVAAWYWYNIVLTNPTRLRMRMAAIFPVRNPLSTIPVLVRWNMEIVDAFFALQIDVEGTPVNVGAMRAFTLPGGAVHGRHRYEAVMEAWRLAILARGEDAADPFTVDRIPLHSGIEDLRMTWRPGGRGRGRP